MSLIRLGVIGLAFLAMLRPGCVQKIEKSQSAVLLFLIDASRSMELPHIADDSTRWGTVMEMVNANQSRLKQLAENKIDVRFFTFDNQNQPVEVEDGVVNLPDNPEGSETDIGTAIYETSMDVRDQRLLGVFVATDCVQNVLDPEVELSQAAEALADMEVPLIGVQLGSASDSGQLADISITNFAEQQVVNKKNDLITRVTVVSRGFPNQDITLQLLVSDSAGNESVVANQIYRPSSSYEEANVELKYRPTEPGEFRIKVRALPMPGERALRNNELDGFLTVRDKGMRVLFLNGSVGNEQRFLRDSLSVIDFIEMDFQPIYTFKNARDQDWPIKRFEEDFIDPKKYDVFILCNVDSRALYDASHTTSLQALADAVAAGKGLLMLGGPHSFGAGLYQETPLKGILPIEMKPTERQEYDQDVRKDLHINTPFKVTPTMDHFLTRISGSGNNKQAWEKLPPLVGANRIKVKDTATVYLQSDDNVKRPILASSTINGRVLVFAGDSSWRWKRYRFASEYDQFWRQVILWLAGWDNKNDESVSIELPKRRFSPKALVNFDVSVNTIAGAAVDGVNFESVLIKPDGQSDVITINQVGEKYQSELDPESLAEPGLYKIQVAASRDGASIGNSEREFVVMDRDKEKSNPMANPEQLKKLTSQTSKFGGKTIGPEQVSEILDVYINDPPMTKIEVPLKWRLGESFPSAALFLGAFVALLGTEWLLRKKWGLV
ncbi:MAG: glutamine amidotransferase [Mariniblastus sp.]|nr:glutamine amidotransferase [Mariniblastus sp.]